MPADDDPFGCLDIDECAEDPEACPPLRDCINTPGDFECTDCPPGYRMRTQDGFCVDIDECAELPDACDPLTTCINFEVRPLIIPCFGARRFVFLAFGALKVSWSRRWQF